MHGTLVCERAMEIFEKTTTSAIRLLLPLLLIIEMESAQRHAILLSKRSIGFFR